MMIDIDHFKNVRDKCPSCSEPIICDNSYWAVYGEVTTYRCSNYSGHYWSRVSIIAIDISTYKYAIEEEAFALPQFNVHIDYNALKATVVNNELVSIVLNLNDSHRVDGLLVSRDGLAKLTHKASIVKHFR